MNWWHEKEKGGGALGALGSHIIDSLQYLTGSKITSVNGTLKTFFQQRTDENKQVHQVTSDDFVQAQLEFDGGFIGALQTSVITPEDAVHNFSVSGDKGTLAINYGTLTYFKNTEDGSRGGKREIILEEDLSMEAPLNDIWGLGSYEIGLALRKFIEEGDNSGISIAATIEDGVYTQKVMAAIESSSKLKKWCKV